MNLQNHFQHITLDSGHSRTSLPGEVDPEINTLVGKAIDECLATNRMAEVVAGSGFHVWIRHTKGSYGYFGRLYRDVSETKVPVVAFAFSFDHSASVWKEICSVSMTRTKAKMPQEPWLAVTFLEGVLRISQEELQELGDLERVVGWALMEAVGNSIQLDNLVAELEVTPFVLSRIRAWGYLKAVEKDISKQAERMIKEKYKPLLKALSNEDIIYEKNLDVDRIKLHLALDKEVLMLDLSMNGEPLVHVLTPDAMRLLSSTRMKIEIKDQLEILKKPLLISSRSGFLFDDVIELCIFFEPQTERFHLMKTVKQGDSTKVLTLSIASDVFMNDALSIADDNEKDENLKQMATVDLLYALKFRMLMESEKSPVESKPSTSSGGKIPKGVSKIVPSYRTVSLTQEYVARRAGLESARTGLDKEGKHLALVEVSGFIRDQAYGPGREKRKTIYIDGFESHRWRTDGIQMVKVKE